MRTALYVASAGPGEVLHAAVIGDDRSVCGHPLDLVWPQDWEAAPQDSCCPRCHDAVDVLRLISAL